MIRKIRIIMKHSSIILIGSGLLIGFVIGYSVQGSHPKSPGSPAADGNQKMEQAGGGAAASSGEEARLAPSNHTPVPSGSGLDVDTEQLRSVERKAARYDWLQKNGMQTYGLMFDENTFTPQPQLLEFMGLNDAESEQLRTQANTAEQAVKDWELANAQCTADTVTNCVYELPPLPEEYKDGFLRDLATLFDPEDIETMTPIVDKLYDRLSQKRTVSVTYVTKEDYLQRIAPHYRAQNSIDSDMLELNIVYYAENGNQRGSSSTMFGIDSTNHDYGMQARWTHLFKYGSATE